jgi:ABC-type nitrate/sulfonate/bicarbonate transport system substrate-binding protein
MDRARRSRLHPLALIPAAVLLAASCGGSTGSSTTTAGPASTTTSTRPAPLTTTTTTLPPTIPVRLGVTPSLAFGIPFVLADPTSGIGAANALDVEVTVYDSSREALDAALAGEVDIVFPDTFSALTAVAGGACLKAPLGFVDIDAMRLVGRADLITADDLIGRKVGTVAGSPAETALRMWLLDQGAAPDEVEVVDTAPVDLVTALSEQQVDAVIWTEPLPSQALAACGEETCRYVGDITASYREVGLVNVTCTWQQAHGDAGMVRLVQAWLEAREYLRNNVEAAATITADRLRLTPTEVAERWRARGWLEAWRPNLDDAGLAMVEAYGAYLVEEGDLAAAPDLCAWVDATWLGQVAPELVSLTVYPCPAEDG